MPTAIFLDLAQLRGTGSIISLRIVNIGIRVALIDEDWNWNPARSLFVCDAPSWPECLLTSRAKSLCRPTATGTLCNSSAACPMCRNVDRLRSALQPDFTAHCNSILRRTAT